MSLLLDQVRDAVARRQLITRGEGVLVALSGGADSVVLGHVLHTLAARQGWKLACAHFNHQLRGRESDADAALASAWARQWGWSCEVAGGNVRAYARKHKLSVEMAARACRHEFLAAATRRSGFAKVAVAHHADDQVELFFLRLLRGAGSEGLGGMQWMNPSPSDPGISLVRPLLGIPKQAILDYAAEHQLTYCEDASNGGVDILRNRIRSELIPLLERSYQPAVRKVVLRAMDILAAEADLIADESHAWLAGKGSQDFAKLPLALKREVIRRQMAGLKVAPEFEWVEALCEKPFQSVTLAQDLVVCRDEVGKLLRQPAQARTFQSDCLAVALTSKGGVEFAGRRFDWEVIPTPRHPLALIGSAVKREFFDADKVGTNIRLRHWQAGDRFQPSGCKTPVKLQNLFVNNKIGMDKRRSLVVAEAADGTIFWVEGLRIGECYKLDKTTKMALIWGWQGGELGSQAQAL